MKLHHVILSLVILIALSSTAFAQNMQNIYDANHSIQKLHKHISKAANRQQISYHTIQIANEAMRYAAKAAKKYNKIVQRPYTSYHKIQKFNRRADKAIQSLYQLKTQVSTERYISNKRYRKINKHADRLIRTLQNMKQDIYQLRPYGHPSHHQHKNFRQQRRNNRLHTYQRGYPQNTNYYIDYNDDINIDDEYDNYGNIHNEYDEYNKAF